MKTADDLSSVDAPFLSGLAHELRTPLTAIRGFADLLMALDGPDDEMVRREITARLLRNTLQLEALVDNMLDAATLGRLESLHPRRVSLRSLAHEVVDEIALTLGPHDIEVHGMPAYAFADPYAVTRILMSLLTNAAQHSPDGSRIDVGTDDRADGRVVMSVTDAGPGIPEHERDVVFDAFWRSERARQAYRGLGVGLSIARDLCFMSNGDITVRSAPEGSGTRFEVDLPAAN